MKSILIPTDYSEDTLQALELTLRNVGDTPVQVVLLSFSPLPDVLAENLFLPPNEGLTSERRKFIVDEWNMRQSLLDTNIQLIEYHVYGGTPAILQQIMELFHINDTIVPHSFQKSERLVHQQAMRSLNRAKAKVTWMPEREIAVPFRLTETHLSV
ncbi:hypothetical protein [Chryseolinea lacunae]|uniref:UspA domain-containing protein n=1 Tax=Chryseolinea lacunae TaxID=2801331 RepID=A0ABS1KQ34_9BACT|nr:hypothetical protein [Chryseolinea lacunae]MBL0741312.1 hypothetical protein [Chryseolinea lacunae]